MRQKNLHSDEQHRKKPLRRAGSPCVFSNFVCIRSNPYLFENCGARLAALRPYFIEPYALYPLILLAFTVRSGFLTPILTHLRDCSPSARPDGPPRRDRLNSSRQCGNAFIYDRADNHRRWRLDINLIQSTTPKETAALNNQYKVSFFIVKKEAIA